MFVRDFPSAVVLDEDQGCTLFSFDEARACFEVGVEDKGGNPDVAEEVDLQVLGLHRQGTDGAQPIMLTLAGAGRILAADRRGWKLGKLRPVIMIAVQAWQVLLRGRIEDFVQPVLDLRASHR